MDGRPSILLAVCDTYLAGVYGRKFERDGWDVEVVESLAEAEHRAVQMRPAVLLFEAACVVDVAKEICRLKSLPTLLKTHVVVLADKAHMGDIDAARKAGAKEYLLLGHFLPEEIVIKMRRLLTM